MARGFTLLELMIVVVIIAIIASFALYNYGRYGYRARRADGKDLLVRVAAAEERYFTNTNTYTSDLTDAPTDGGLGFASTDSEKGYYTIAVTVSNGGASYLLTATNQNEQANDKCGALTLTDTGVKGQSGDESNGKCW